VLSLAMIILTFQRVRSLASTLLSTPFLHSSQISVFKLNMFLSPVVLTWNIEESPSMRHVRARGASSAIEDCCRGVDVVLISSCQCYFSRNGHALSVM
jgi:hypothetical protein